MLDLRTGLIQVALGRIAPETIIRDVRVVNVYSGEILETQEVALWRDRIAFVGQRAPQAGPETQIIEGQGMYLLPGFIDVHGHTDFITNPLAVARQILPTGTTGMLSDTHDICGAMGVKGLSLMLRATEKIPFRYYFSIPAASRPLPEFEGGDNFINDIIRAGLGNKRVVAISELTAWGRLMEPDEDVVANLVLAMEHGKRIEGHMAGTSYEKINALVACGVSSCHESITPEEALDRLRLGVHVILRHGSVREDLGTLSRIVTENPNLDTSRIMLSPDWYNPQDILKYGYMNYQVSQAIEFGIPPVKAIQMVTINPATYLGLEREIGGIAPGRLADILLVEDLANPIPHLVIVGGETVAREGKLLVEIPDFPEVPLDDWRKERVPDFPVEASNFGLAADPKNPEFTCIQMVNKTITKALSVSLPVCNGQVDISANPEILKISLWSALKGGWVTALLAGFGASIGGIAVSFCHETHAPLVLGCNDYDMALAVNLMLEMGGGAVIAQDGHVVVKLPLKAGGQLSSANVEETARGWYEINSYLQERGCPWDDPLLGISFLGFTGLPYVRITPSGVVDIRKKEIIFPY